MVYAKKKKVGQRTLIEVLNAQQELLQSRSSSVTERNVLVATYTVIAAIGRLSVSEVGAVDSVGPIRHIITKKCAANGGASTSRAKMAAASIWISGTPWIEREPTK